MRNAHIFQAACDDASSVQSQPSFSPRTTTVKVRVFLLPASDKDIQTIGEDAMLQKAFGHAISITVTSVAKPSTLLQNSKVYKPLIPYITTA
jgi:hypothetical protein